MIRHGAVFFANGLKPSLAWAGATEMVHPEVLTDGVIELRR
ncbi:MAG: hypothetical protein ACLP50_33220 [Solirubrobacteraceae bacterium]